MLFLYLMVGFALAVPEVIFVEHIPPLKKFCEKYPLAEMIWSLIFGYVVGKAMGLSGVAIAIGNVFSTVITKCVYNWHLIAKWKNFRTHIIDNANLIKTKYGEIRTAVVLLAKILFFPIWAIMFALRGWSRLLDDARAKRAQWTRASEAER